MASSRTTKPADDPQETAAQETPQRALERIAAEVAPSNMYDDDALREIGSLDEAMQLAGVTLGHTLESVDQVLGDGFQLLSKEDKKRLVGLPCLFMEWSFRPGDYDGLFVSCRVVVANPQGGVSKYIINDGGTGIAEQLAKYQERTGKTGGLFAPRGLRESSYPTGADGKPLSREDLKRDPSLKKGIGTTYYIDTSA